MKCCNAKGMFTDLLEKPKKRRGQKKGAIPSTTDKLKEEARSIGLTLNGLSVDKKMTYRNYTVIKCGHTLDLCTGNVRKTSKAGGTFKCCKCYAEKEEEFKNNKGLDFIRQYEGNDFARPNRYSHFRFIDCGHEVIALRHRVKNSDFRCEKCIIENHVSLAYKRGLEYLGNASDTSLPNRFSNYKFKDCGHTRDIDRVCVERNNFKCHVCKTTFLTQKSNLYVYKISTDDSVFLKFGYGKNVKSRIREYGLPEGCKAELLVSYSIESGRIALRLEQEIHREYSEYNLHHNEMRKYFRLTGHTECYPLEVKDAIISTIRNKVEELHGNKE